MEYKQFCQSCGMPLTDDIAAKEKDGSASADYCSYCYRDGAFTAEMTMQQMIDFCVPHTVKNTDMNEEEARKMMNEFFPTMKRWKANN